MWALATSRLGIGAIAGVLLLAALAAFQMQRSRAQLAEERLDVALSTITDLSADLEILWEAGRERADDKQRLDTEREELTDAINVAGDSPFERELRFRCVLWKQQRGEHGLPAACAGLDGEAGAAVGP